jgi:acyl-CoA reductase-like NAD-dependent aldehyde dehydrogenase
MRGDNDKLSCLQSAYVNCSIAAWHITQFQPLHVAAMSHPANGHAATARDMAVRARNASRKLQAMSTQDRVAMLHRIADALLANEAHIMAENAKVILRDALEAANHQ